MFSIIQAGNKLQFLNEDGELTDLVLPTGVDLRTDVKPRWTVEGRYVVLVNTPSLPLTIDANGKVRLLAPRPPRLGAILSNENGGSLSGTYFSRYTFVVVDEFGNLISESDYSPLSNTTTITTDYLKASNLDLSPDEISGRRLYRTTTNGAILFQWIDLDGNVLRTVRDDLSDAGLSLFASPTLGSPPYLTHISSFRGRLFGIAADRPDYLRFTEAGIRYAWPDDNGILIQPEGADYVGVNALIPRRDALGAAKLNSLWQIVGSGEENSDGIPDFEPIRVSDILGVVSQESVDVYRDTAYFLWYDGVYKWNSEGIICISDGQGGKGMVRKWFTTDDYFNRARYPYAFGKVDPVRLVYKLFLASADSDVEDTWVEYSLKDGTWWGPHSTREFHPLSIFQVNDPSNTSVIAPMVGATEGYLYAEQALRTDGENRAIHLDVVGKRHDVGTPEYEKYFGHLSVYGQKQDEGILVVKTRVGELEEEVPQIRNHDLTLTRERLGRLGTGKHVEIEFENDVVDQDAVVYGYEINPINIVGRR